MTHHLHPTADLASRVLLPGDPGRALLLAQDLLERPLMFNHHRGLWGYTGVASDGEPMTIQATGMGGPSAAIVVTELVELGATRLVRVGTCRALAGDLRLGDLVLADRALALDGASVALGARDPVQPDGALLAALRAADPGATVGPVASVDLFTAICRRGASGALAVDMQAATVLQAARTLGMAAACVLVVTDELGASDPAEGDALEAAGLAVGRLGATALLAV